LFFRILHHQLQSFCSSISHLILFILIVFLYRLPLLQFRSRFILILLCNLPCPKYLSLTRCIAYIVSIRAEINAVFSQARARVRRLAGTLQTQTAGGSGSSSSSSSSKVDVASDGSEGSNAALALIEKNIGDVIAGEHRSIAASPRQLSSHPRPSSSNAPAACSSHLSGHLSLQRTVNADLQVPLCFIADSAVDKYNPQND
jgi:hypothetical protein